MNKVGFKGRNCVNIRKIAPVCTDIWQERELPVYSTGGYEIGDLLGMIGDLPGMVGCVLAVDCFVGLYLSVIIMIP